MNTDRTASDPAASDPAASDEIKLAGGRSALKVHQEELAMDLRFERTLLVKEVCAVAIVVGIIVARQLWFV